jgi:hypothetical protein
MNYFKKILSLLAIVLLSACGGGGSNSGSPLVGGAETGNRLSDLVVVLSGTTLANTGNGTIEVAATALDANRNALAGVPVTLSVDNGAILSTAGTVTGADGKIVGSVGIGADRSNRTITVTARSGSIERTASFAVVDSSGTALASEMVLVLSSASIANNGTQTVTATATALDAKRNTLPGVAVALTVDSNAVITPNGTTTDATGTVRGAIGIGSDRSNRSITVTATAGSLVRTATLLVSDATGGTPVAADLSLVLSAPTLTNAGTTTIAATATAVDANRNAVSGIPITLKVDSSALLTVSGPTTNVAGVVTGNVGIGSDRSNRLVTVTATSGTLTRSASFRVVGADLTAAFTPLIDAGSANNRIEFKLVDTNAAAMVGQPISVSSPGLPSTTGVTDFAGKFIYEFTAPSTTGSLAFTAAAAGDSETVVISVQQPGGGAIPPATESPRSASIAPSPSVVSVNTVGSTLNQVELRALFLGANNQPIPRVRVRFDLDGNAFSTDGVVNWLGGNFAYSDSSGVARGTFIPGQRSSPTNGVTVRACYDVNDFPAGTCPFATTATLTVASEALSVSIGTNELIKSGVLTYIKEFVVLVVDAAGQAKSDVLITPSIDLTDYYKGFYVRPDDTWVQTMTLPPTERYRWEGNSWLRSSAGLTGLGRCPNEDINRNAVREAAAFDANVSAPAIANRSEDLNWNGDLDPRKADVAIRMVGSPRTDTSGLAVLQIEYPRNLGSWIDFVITVTASGITGTEVRAKFSDRLPVPVEAVKAEGSPAFVTSPYGVSDTCTDPK